MMSITMKMLRAIFIQVTLFSIAMGFLESSVVVYLREMMYPEGFSFPLVPMSGTIALTEFLREAATLVMLVTISLLAGKTFSQRFAWFIYAFAVWDIFYYVFLKILLNWPDSPMTWDILFLIPIIWTGPVISPVIVSITMILLAGVILFFAGKGADTKILPLEWILLVSGAAVVFVSFIWDFMIYIARNSVIDEILTDPEKQSSLQIIASYIPQKFNWLIFIAGEIILVFTVCFYYLRMKKLIRRN